MREGPPYLENSACRDDWRPGPSSPRLRSGELHVWLADLTTVRGDVKRHLTAQERARGDGVLNTSKGELWARSRGALRELVGRYARTAPGDLRFATSVHGKPYLAEPAGAIAFNLSHSGSLGVYAFVAAGEVGVDVQVARPSSDEFGVARRVFGDPEARRMWELPAEERRPRFLREWSRREAALKCVGTGLAATRPNTDHLSLTDLRLGDRAAGAVAADAPKDRVLRWRFLL
jgi:4'-phosphopantetheinyl transferase